MDLALIISLVFFLFVALAALRGWRKGRKKSWQSSLVRFLVILISAIISIFVAKKIASTVTDVLFEKLAAGSLPEELIAIFEDLPSAPAIILTVVAMIVAPILFYPVNFIIKLILKIFSPIFVKLITKLTNVIVSKRQAKAAAEEAEAEAPAVSDAKTEELAAADESADGEQNAYVDVAFDDNGTETSLSEDGTPEADVNLTEESDEVKPKKQKKQKKARKAHRTYDADSSGACGRGFGIAFGILAGVLGVFVFFAPIMGALGLVGMIEETIANAGVSELEEAKPALDAVDSATHNAAVGTVNALGGRLIFNSLTTFRVNGEKITLAKEAELVCTVAKTAMTVSDEAKTAEEKSAALKDVLPAFDKSGIIPVLLSEFLSGASTAWEAGEDFCGVSLPVEDGAMSDLLIEAISLFKDSTPTTVKEDAATIINIVSVVIRNDLIGNMPEDPMTLLGNKTLISDLFYEVFENDRLNVLVSSLVNTGIEMMTAAIGVPENLDEVHAKFITEISASRTAANADELRAAYGAIFKKYGINITDKALSDFATSMISAYGLEVPSIDSTELENLLSSVKINKDGEDKTVNLSDKTAFSENTLLVTTEMIEAAHGTPGKDSRAEADALADVFASVPEVTTLFSGENVVIADTVKALGKILDKFAACGNIGKACVDNLIVALLQSEVVYDAIAMDKVTATHFANSVVSGTGDGKTYEQIMGDIANVINTMTDVTDSDEFDSEKVESVLMTLTPETATALKHVVNGALVDQIGMSGGNSEGVSNILSSVFDNIATAKRDGMDDATYETEVKKVSDLLNTTMTITDDSEKSIDVETYVNSAMDSVIVSDALADNVYGEDGSVTLDPLGNGTNLDDTEKASLLETLQENIDNAEASDKERTERNAVAVAAYLNVPVEVVDGQIKIIEP